MKVLTRFDVDINGTTAGNNVELGWFTISSKARRIIAVGLNGSGAAGDCKISLFYGDHKVGEFDNTSTDDVGGKEDLRYIGTNFVLAPKMPLRVEVITASGSACYLTLISKNLTRRRRRRF